MSNSGVYLLINDSNEVVYVGRSVNVSGRISSHKKDKEFSHYSIIECEKCDQKTVEREMIHKHKPKYNKQFHKREPKETIVMRIELTKEESDLIMKAKGGFKKTAYAKRVLMEAVKRDNNKKDKKK